MMTLEEAIEILKHKRNDFKNFNANPKIIEAFDTIINYVETRETKNE